MKLAVIKYVIVIALSLMPLMSMAYERSSTAVEDTLSSDSIKNKNLTRMYPNDCELEYLNPNPGELRGYGYGEAKNVVDALNDALLYAKASLAMDISFNSNEIKQLKQVRDKSEKRELYLKKAALIPNVYTIVSTCQTNYSNGLCKYSICISIPEEIARQIQDSINEENFRQSYYEELERFRKIQKNKSNN